MQAESVKHLLFYDGECGLCDRAVQFVLKHDEKGIFCYAPLQGTTAKRYFGTPPSLDTLILVENFQSLHPVIHMRGKGAFRILWLLGGVKAIPGLLYFLPAFSYDWAYRLIANNRNWLFSKESCQLPNPSEQRRFLP